MRSTCSHLQVRLEAGAAGLAAAEVHKARVLVAHPLSRPAGTILSSQGDITIPYLLHSAGKREEAPNLLQPEHVCRTALVLFNV